MRLDNRKNKTSSKHPSNTLLGDDLSSIAQESRLEKFKPALKVLLIATLLSSAIWVTLTYFSGDNKASDASKTYSSNTSQYDESIDDKFYQCTADMNIREPIPDADEDSFYPKLVAYYDAQLSCYDLYPNASGAVSRSTLEYQRNNAVDSSGDFKNIYIPPSEGTLSSSRNSVTGCDYSLSESEYLACSDSYYATRSSNSGASPNDTNAPSYTPPAPQTPSTPNSAASPDTKHSDPYAALNACLDKARNMPGGEASRARAVQGCYQDHTPSL